MLKNKKREKMYINHDFARKEIQKVLREKVKKEMNREKNVWVLYRNIWAEGKQIDREEIEKQIKTVEKNFRTKIGWKGKTNRWS